MNKVNKKWVVLGLVGVFLLGGIAFAGFQTHAQIADFLPSWITDKVDRMIQLEREDAIAGVAREKKNLGAVSSPDLGNYYVVGGNVFRGFSDDTLISASTTLCAIESPAASSTLVSAGITIDNGSSTDIVIEIAKSVGQPSALNGGGNGNPNATTSLITSYWLPNNEKRTITASTTGIDLSFLDFGALVNNVATTTGDDTNDWLIFYAYASETDPATPWDLSSTFNFTGHCNAVFQER